MSRALAVLGAVALLIGGVLLYARSELFDPPSLGDNAGSALADEDVRVAISPTIADAIGEATPETSPSEEEVATALENPRVQGTFELAAGAAARELFREDRGDLDVDLSEVSAVAVAVTEDSTVEELGISASDYESARLEVISGKAVLDVIDIAEQVGWLGLVLTPLAGLALILSVLLAPDKLRGLTFAGLCVAAVAVVLLATLYVGREIVLAQFGEQLTRDAVSAAWDALLGGLVAGALIAGGAGIVIAIGSAVAASRRRAY